jgi:hypothetical protein
MKTDTEVKTAPVQAVREGLSTRARRGLASVVAMVAAGICSLLTSAVAGASSPPDPTGGGAATLSSDITGWVTSYGVPAIIIMLATGLVVTLFIKYSKRGAKAI